MSKVTARQRMLRTGQPYTEVRRIAVPRVEAQPDGTPIVLTAYVHAVFGYTLEDKFVNEEWEKTWEEHDLGQAATRLIADETAAAWREGLVGEYAISGGR